MKAIQLIKHGNPKDAFSEVELPDPDISSDEMLIEVEAFGLNFADVMARLGLYQDAPPLPSVIGYDIVGRITKKSNAVHHFQVGDRVVAMTRFGGYASLAKTKAIGAHLIPDSMDAGDALALATQYSTAYYCAHHMVSLKPGDNVLIHAAAGGVGIGLTQLCKRLGCKVYGTASSSKQDFIVKNGVDFPIDYTVVDFKDTINNMGKRMDVIFDSIGGKSVKEGMQILDVGGRMVCYGAASLTQARGNIFKMIKTALGFGRYSPIGLLKKSQSVNTVNMLHIADHKPHHISDCMTALFDLYEAGEIKPHIGGRFKSDQIADAHKLLENRKSIGKVVVEW